jgi:hypothetical protein
MKRLILLLSIITLFIVYSCEKHELAYDSSNLDLTKSAQVRIVYDLPVTGTAFSITRLKLNDQLYSEVSTVVGSIFPNSVAKYFVVPAGQVKVETFTGATKDVLQYSNNCTVEAGKKYSVYIYDLTQAPLVVQDADVFPVVDPWADTVCHIQFVNLLFKPDGTPYGKLFLKGRRGAGTTASPYVYADVAQCDFKQASALIKYPLKGTSTAGTESSMTFVLYNENGSAFQFYPSSTGALTTYTATGFSLTKGRNYIFHLNGKTAVKYADQIIRLSTITLN